MDLDLFKVLKIIYINSVIHFTTILFYCYQVEMDKSQKKPSPFCLGFLLGKSISISQSKQKKVVKA